MMDRDDEKESEHVLEEIFGSDLCPSEGSSYTPEPTATSPCATKRVLARRRVYSKNALWALRHEEVLSLPKAITKPLECPGYEIPTLNPNEPTAFSALSLPKELLDALSSLSLTTASAIQSTAIPYARLGGDLVAQATSGTGKTLTYALVALDTILPSSRTRSAFVIVPTRELAYQVADLFSRLATIRVVTLVGGTKERVDVENLSRPADVIVGTPGRVEVMMSRGVIDVSSIKVLVLDEADRLLDGSFGGSVEHICNMIPTRQTLAFSATFSYSFRVSLMEVMREPAWIGGSDVVHSVVQRKVECRDLNHKISVLKGMLQPVNLSLCLVFLNAKKAAGRLVRTLNKSLSFVSKLVHAGITQKERDAAIRGVRQGNVHVLVTTDVLARGIDFDSCDMVIHMDVPQAAETYLHRVGRAGRFGRKGSSTLLFDESEVSAVLALEADLGFDIKSPTVPNSENVFMPIRPRSDRANTVSNRGVSEIEPFKEHNERNETKRLEKLAESKSQELQNTSPANTPQPRTFGHAMDEVPADHMDVEKVTTRMNTSEAVQINRPQKVEEPSPQIELKQMSQKQFKRRGDAPIEAGGLENTTEDMPAAYRPTKIPLTAVPSKRSRLLEEPATPAKKRKSARALIHSSPNHEMVQSSRAQSEGNTPSEEPRRANFFNAKEGGNPGFLASAQLSHESDENVMELETREAPTSDHPRKEGPPNPNAVILRNNSPRAEDPGTNNTSGITLAKMQTDTDAGGVPVRNQQSQECDENMHDVGVTNSPVGESAYGFATHCREAWDRYAAAAYDEGYREAYKEAFQIANRLRGRLLLRER